MHILVTGGLGYIGRHFVVVALDSGFKITVLDNLSNSSPQVIEDISDLNAQCFSFIKADLREKDQLEAIFKSDVFDAVVHFAGLKSVSESKKAPLRYYENNVIGSFNLLNAMHKAKVKNMLFSSSATVYGHPIFNPYTETHPTVPINPYGQTKRMVEKTLRNYCDRYDFSAVSLRYFNPIGAHPSGIIGDTAVGTPNNLMPYILQVAKGNRPFLPVFGDDYSTPDGTCVRDYIHVMDLVDAHIKALAYLIDHKGFGAFNIGTGDGYSVLQVIDAFEKVNQKRIPYLIKPRREGDLAAYWADVSLAFHKLKWQAKRSLEEMVHDSWLYHRQ